MFFRGQESLRLQFVMAGSACSGVREAIDRMLLSPAAISFVVSLLSTLLDGWGHATRRTRKCNSEPNAPRAHEN